MKNLLFLFSIFLFLSVQSFSQVTIHVPGDFTTIQAAINAANNDDIVLVAEGTYYENINFMGKAITVASHFYLDKNDKHIRKTIINESQPVDPDYGSVVYFASGEDTNSIICDFTITGGTGTLNINQGFPTIHRGGGIFLVASGAKIINNIVADNKVENEVWCFGGGGWIGDAFSFTKIIDNTIIKNHVEMKGGAIYTKSAAPTFMNSILWNNQAPEGSEIYVESGIIDVTYSDVIDGWTRTVNMNANPKLISLFSLLNHNSPCIDTGNPDIMYNDPESGIFPGYTKLPARGTVRNDMGAHGLPYADDWWNFLNFRKEMQSAELEEEIVSRSTHGNIRFRQYPNPFNPSTKITYTLQEAAMFRWRYLIYLVKK